MCQIDVTEFFNTCDPTDYAASAHEIGQDAGRVTWANALRDAVRFPLLASSDAQSAMVDYLRASGGWTQEECEAFTGVELTALCIQFIAGDMREGHMESDTWSWHWYQCRIETGTIEGRLSRNNDGRVYYNLGN